MAAILALLPLQVFAITQPATIQFDTASSAPVKAYRNILETNDLLVTVEYSVTYAGCDEDGVGCPTEDVNSAYFGRLMNGATELQKAPIYSAAIIPYKGYTRGLFSFYFTAATAPAWEGAYTVVIQGNPTLTWDGGTPPSTSTTTISWSTLTSQSAVQSLFGSNIIIEANSLSSVWDVALTTSSGGSQILSTSGITYFSGAIVGFASMAAAITGTGSGVPVSESTNTNSNSNNQPVNQWGGTSWHTLFTIMGTDFGGIGFPWIMFLVFLGFGGVVVWGLTKAGIELRSAVLFSPALLVVIMIVGWASGLVPTLIVVLFGMLCAVIMLGLIFLRGLAR